MPQRVCWKKGMRLTDEILRKSDSATAEFIGKAMMLAAAGRFGLLPCARPFKIALNLTKDYVEVESLSCLAISKGGHLIDLDYDTRFSNATETRVALPDNNKESELLLTVNVDNKHWKETKEGCEEPEYTFSFISANSPLAESAMPIARIVDSEYGGWHIDETGFVPPCLFVSSHHKFVELLEKFQEVLTNIDAKTRMMLRSQGKDAIRIFWPIIQQIRITVDKERDTLTPMALLGHVQKVVSAFNTACALDEVFMLSDADMLQNYASAPYNYKDVYSRIKEGLEICFSIVERVGRMEIREEEPAPTPQKPKTDAPYISEDQLFQNCRSKTVKIPVINPVAGAVVYYSTNGGVPKQKLAAGSQLVVDNKFNTKRVPEPDQIIEIKLKSVLNGVSSEENSFSVTLHKDYKVWAGPEI